MKINATQVHFYLDQTIKAANRQETKQAFRYWLLAANEIRLQRHISKADKIQQHMQTIAFKIEIDASFETAENINN